MRDRVLFVERSGELCVQARLSGLDPRSRRETECEEHETVGAYRPETG